MKRLGGANQTDIPLQAFVRLWQQAWNMNNPHYHACGGALCAGVHEMEKFCEGQPGRQGKKVTKILNNNSNNNHGVDKEPYTVRHP